MWTLHDENGPVRRDLEEEQARDLIQANAEQGPPVVTWATGPGGRIEAWDGPIVEG